MAFAPLPRSHCSALGQITTATSPVFTLLAQTIDLLDLMLCGNDDFHTVACIQFDQQHRHGVLDRLLADLEFIGDLAIGWRLQPLARDLFFTGAETNCLSPEVQAGAN